MSIEERVLSYLKNNPGATPREIADAIGVSLASVRAAINKLRESGLVIRSSRGGYVARVSSDLNTVEYPASKRAARGFSIDDLTNVVNDLLAKIDELSERVAKLEGEIKFIKKSLPDIRVKSSKNGDNDKLLTALELRHLLPINEALKLSSKTLEEYVSSGKVAVIDELVVSLKFLNKFKSKLPIKVGEVDKLSSEERRLLDALIKAGHVYLYSGVEYRLAG